MARSFVNFYNTYAKFVNEDEERLICENINYKNPALSLMSCTMWVQNVLSNAREMGDERFVDIQGVRITCSLLIRLGY